MTDRSKFEEMLEHLVNEDRSKAEEIFHDIVVEKSREIYENLLAEENDEEVDEATDEEVEEATADDEEVEENFVDEADPSDDMMGDVAMDMDMDSDDDADDMGMDDKGGDVEDRVDDLEAELEALRDEFAKIMDDADGDDEDGDMDMDDKGDMDMDMDMDKEEESVIPMEASDEEVEEASEEEVDESPKSDTEQMREYVEKVAGGGLDAKKIGGDNGANPKSVVASKNDMGGTAANIATGGEGGGSHTGLTNNNAKEDSAGNVNVPGGSASKSMKAQPGHGAEKKSKPENADNKKSTIGS